MNYKTLIMIFLVLMIITGCSVFERVIYHPEINQGNYLTTADIAKIHIGMTKKQIVYILGTPMLKDPFGSNILYYIFRRDHGIKSIFQQTLILTFNNVDILTHIEFKPMKKTTNIS
ncbi:outer membrane protein assembly factor BamE [Candidatus Curculioniphilus buchneri]|uniref:outer membrane protein assembly factor BamE n=1 Tax=Candidatus Curculioniphilus buchneri TaxID=690594 RepID=UPI00376EDBEE